MHRRTFLQGCGAGLGLLALSPVANWAAMDTSANALPANVLPDYAAWQLSTAEWQARLSPEQFRVLRKHGTEPAHSSPLDKNTAAGVYHCAGCNLAVYSSDHKYDSKTGWPSFWENSYGHLGTSTDYKLIWPRTEIHCARCKGHLGHVFDDGPQPTGKRYCMNGIALTFIPATATTDTPA